MIDDITDQESVLEQDTLPEVTDDEQQGEAPEDLGPGEPVPVEETDQVYNDFKEAFGEEQAMQLQSKWGDKAVQNEAVVQAVMQDHPSLDQIYTDHQSEDGSVTVQGLTLAAEYLLEKTGFNDLEELSANFPELDAVILENYNEHNGTISAVGIYQALAYIGKRSNYRYTHRGP